MISENRKIISKNPGNIIEKSVGTIQMYGASGQCLCDTNVGGLSQLSQMLGVNFRTL